MTLTEFLLARIAEGRDRAERMDEHYAPLEREWEWCPRALPGPLGDLPGGPEAECQCSQPAAKRRALAECEAKRAILAELEEVQPVWDDLTAGYSPEDWLAKRVALALAAVYADHPDYDEAWRPGVS